MAMVLANARMDTSYQKIQPPVSLAPVVIIMKIAFLLAQKMARQVSFRKALHVALTGFVMVVDIVFAQIVLNSAIPMALVILVPKQRLLMSAMHNTVTFVIYKLEAHALWETTMPAIRALTNMM